MSRKSFSKLSDIGPSPLQPGDSPSGPWLHLRHEKAAAGQGRQGHPQPPGDSSWAGPELANMEEVWSFKWQSSVTYLTLNTDNTY